MSGPDFDIIFLIFLIAFSLHLALWRSILMEVMDGHGQRFKVLNFETF